MGTDAKVAIDFPAAVLRLAACHASLADRIAALTEEWKPETPPPTIIMSALGDTLAGAAVGFSGEDLECVFLAVEGLLDSGDEKVKDATATGLLEALLAQASANKVDFTLFAQYLGPQSRRYCREWDRFTGCTTPGLE